jgi:PAS domain S-box-containing protein
MNFFRKLCNQLCAFTIADTLLYELLFVATGIYPLVLIHTVCIGIYFLVLVLNKKRAYTTARNTLMLTTGTEIFIVSCILGNDSGVFLSYFPLISAAFILYDKNEKTRVLWIAGGSLLGIFFLHSPVAELIPSYGTIPEEMARILFLTTLTSSVLITALCVYYLIILNVLTEEQLRKAIHAEENLNRELVVREEELSTNLENLSQLTAVISREKAKLNAIVESYHYWIWLMDTNYRLIYCNTNFREIFYERFGVNIQPGDSVLDVWPEDVRARWQPCLAKALTGQKFTEEVTGKTYIFEVLFNQIVENDQTVGVTIFMKNISERKAAERELIAAKEMAEQASLVKARFLSTMSHEIRTPMNAVIGVTHLLLQQEPRPDQLDLLQMLRFSSENLLSLINDILDLDKIEAGKVTLEEVDFQPAELIRNIIHSHQFKAHEKGIELRCLLDERLPDALKGDSVRLTQVLNNLLSNAVKFTDRGYVTVEVRLSQSSAGRASVYFAVSDTGIGIPKEKQEVVFDAFVQAESATTRKFGGTGLGLAITKRLIELQGSRIQLESVPGIGSKFSFTLTFRTGNLPALTPMDSHSPEEAENLSHVRLLLVEDNPMNVTIAEKFLQKWQIVPDHAENGRIALEKVQQQAYDIIFMDLQMPVMNGFEATQEIRALGGPYRQLPIIALTADTIDNVKERVLAVGMNDLLTKPYSPAGLYRMIIRYGSFSEDGAEKSHQTVSVFSPAPGRFKKLIEMADGDKIFIQEMRLSCRNNLRELQTGYARAMQGRNDQELKSITHKFKSLIILLELENLGQILHYSQQIITDAAADEAEITALIDQISEMCRLVENELNQIPSLE